MDVARTDLSAALSVLWTCKYASLPLTLTGKGKENLRADLNNTALKLNFEK